jgi:hypothetical protein
MAVTPLNVSVVEAVHADVLSIIAAGAVAPAGSVVTTVVKSHPKMVGRLVLA